MSYTPGRVRRVVALVSLVVASALVSTRALGALSVSPIFGSNMVLQRNTTVPVFGTADPGATVSVQFQNQNVSAVASAAGKWQVNLGSMAASTTAGSMTVTSGP